MAGGMLVLALLSGPLEAMAQPAGNAAEGRLLAERY